MMIRMHMKRPTEDIISPAIALPLPPAFFFVIPVIEKIRPKTAGNALSNGIHEIQMLMIPNIRPAVAAPFILVLLSMGVIITGC